MNQIEYNNRLDEFVTALQAATETISSAVTTYKANSEAPNADRDLQDAFGVLKDALMLLNKH